MVQRLISNVDLLVYLEVQCPSFQVPVFPCNRRVLRGHQSMQTLGSYSII